MPMRFVIWMYIGKHESVPEINALRHKNFPIQVHVFISQARIQISFSGESHRKRTHLIIRYFDFRISMDVSLLQEKSTFPVLTMRMSPHLEPFFFFFFIYDCILHKCCAISNQYHFTNPISTFLPKFQGGGGGGGVRTPGPPLWIRPCFDTNFEMINVVSLKVVKNMLLRSS